MLEKAKKILKEAVARAQLADIQATYDLALYERDNLHQMRRRTIDHLAVIDIDLRVEELNRIMGQAMNNAGEINLILRKFEMDRAIKRADAVIGRSKK